MKKENWILVAAISIIAAITGIAAYIWANLWLLLFGAAFILVLYFILALQRKQYEEQMEQISRAMENLLSGKENQPAPLWDTIIHKIQHQIVRLQSMVTAQRQQSKRDNEEIRKLIVEIAHQLRIPLANMETYLDLLNDETIGRKEKEQFYNAVDISQKQLRFLIESFIKMARLESRIIQIKKEDRDLKETVLNCIFQMENAAKERDIQFSFSCQAEMPVPHDRNWLEEAFSNLLDNSMKYSPTGSKVDISLVQNEMFTEIRVRDYGMGIVEGEEAKIFQRFFRGQNVTGQKGFGLGMYISREIIAAHDGFIKVKRQQPGLSCSIFLPLEEKLDL